MKKTRSLKNKFNINIQIIYELSTKEARREINSSRQDIKQSHLNQVTAVQ